MPTVTLNLTDEQVPHLCEVLEIAVEDLRDNLVEIHRRIDYNGDDTGLSAALARFDAVQPILIEIARQTMEKD